MNDPNHIQWNIEHSAYELYRNACHLRELMHLTKMRSLGFTPGDNLRMARYKVQAVLDVMDELISGPPEPTMPLPFESPKHV